MSDQKLDAAADNAAAAAVTLREARLALAFHRDAYNQASELVKAATRDVELSNKALIHAAGGSLEVGS